MSIKQCKTDPSSTKESADAGVNEIQIEINDSSSSHNNNFAISLKSKNVDVDKLLPMAKQWICLLYTSPSPRDRSLSRMPSSA